MQTAESAPRDDARLRLLTDWIADVLGTRAFTVAPASADASFRRYFRAALAQPHALFPTATLIGMDAPPPMENCAPFVHIAGLLRAANVNAP